MTIFGRRPCWSTTYLTRWIRVLPEYYSSLQDEKAKERYVEKISYVGGLDPYRIPRKEWSDSIELARCHRESSTPNFLYPRTEFTSEYGTPVRFPSELCMGIPYSCRVFCIPLCIPYVDTVSPYRLDDYATTIKSKRLCERSRVLGEWATIPMATHCHKNFGPYLI